MNKWGWSFLVVMIMGPTHLYGAIQTKTVDYRDGETVLEGFLAYDDQTPPGQPGVLIAHEWNGLGDYVKRRAVEIARLGYVAFALDMYGKGVRPENPKDAAAEAAIYKNDRNLMRKRADAGLRVLKRDPRVDPSRIAAIGYCFGGTTVLELARSGADLKGVVSFHGGLDTPHPEDAKNIKAKVLILHGADDPVAPAKDVRAIENEMRNAKVDWELVLYGGAVHSFTNPASGGDPSKGAAYNPEADRRSWQAMELFLQEVFGSSESTAPRSSPGHLPPA